MTERDQVIANLLYMKRDCLEGSDNDKTIDRALELLKEQEAIEPVEMIDDFYPIGDPLRTSGWKCGKCMERIAGYDNYCPNCGQEVKWE